MNNAPLEANVIIKKEPMQVDEVKAENQCVNQECSSECETIFENGCKKCLCERVDSQISGSNENN